jgi:hypothetical protein
MIKLGIYLFKGVGWGLAETNDLLGESTKIFLIKDFASYDLSELDGILVTGGSVSHIKGQFSKKAFENLKQFLNNKGKFYIGICAGVMMCAGITEYIFNNIPPHYYSEQPFASSISQDRYATLNVLKKIDAPLFNIIDGKPYYHPYYAKQYYGEDVDDNISIPPHNSDPDKMFEIVLSNNKKAIYREGASHIEFFEGDKKNWVVEATFGKEPVILYNKTYLFFVHHLEHLEGEYFKEVIKKFLNYIS